jgi:hypothetical protein
MTVTREREKLKINTCPAVRGWQSKTAMRTYTQDESRNYAVLTFRGQYSIYGSLCQCRISMLFRSNLKAK